MRLEIRILGERGMELHHEYFVPIGVTIKRSKPKPNLRAELYHNDVNRNTPIIIKFNPISTIRLSKISSRSSL